MRVGLVCPYSLDTPGGVQAHILDLAEALIGLGHEVSVIAPADSETELPAYVTSVGRAVPVPYNGSVARLSFGPMTLRRVLRWLREGQFDVLHVHEPISPSVSLLTCLVARGPIVATFHAASQRSRTLAAAHGALQPVLEKITGRIAVSALARRFQVEHLDGGGVEIPNGVAVGKFADADPFPNWPGSGGAIGFLGRFTEPRKGFDTLLSAFLELAPQRSDLRLLVAGPGDPSEVLHRVPVQLRERISILGKISEADKARMLRSVDIYVAPNTGGESFGIILTEAMAAGTPVVASDLDAFRRVLNDGKAGDFFPVGDKSALASVLAQLLDDPARRAEMGREGRAVVAEYDWSVVAARVVEVYHSAIAATAIRGQVTVEEVPAEQLDIELP
ncbi:MAG: glycosyltransferase family 4 protein [Corynebacteriales bacterium]|nr:glycosyltransferase family 4 protein [Mycobacteriales bacterium]